MKPTYLALFGAFALAATGCAGDFNTGGKDISNNSGADAGAVDETDATPTSELSTAQALFEANVRPIVSATCNPGGACHGSQDPAFISAQPAEAYTTINIHRDRLYPGYVSAGSRLLVNGTGGGHYGAVFSANDLSAIQGWLAQEAIEADSGGVVTASALAVWSGCMELADWDALNVANEWADKDADNQGDCDACHNLGADGFMASNQSLRVFENITTSPALMPSYFTLDASGQNVVINRARFESVGNQLPPHEAHGAFTIAPGDAAMDALQAFYDLTMQRKLAGQCAPPRF
jgi:hypothetical protein